MTASALASSLDTRKGGVSLQGLALTFGKVWRSQFASFVGNIIVVFPLSYLLSVGWEYASGAPLLHDNKESLQALRDQNGRLREVEMGEAGCQARGANLPERMSKVERDIAEAKGKAEAGQNAGQIGSLTGGIALVTQLVQIIASLILGGGSK